MPACTRLAISGSSTRHLLRLASGSSTRPGRRLAMFACVRAMPLPPTDRVFTPGNLSGSRGKIKGGDPQAQTGARRLELQAHAARAGPSRRRSCRPRRSAAAAWPRSRSPASRSARPDRSSARSPAPSRTGCPSRRRRSASRSGPAPTGRPTTRPVTPDHLGAGSGSRPTVALVAPGVTAWSNSMTLHARARAVRRDRDRIRHPAGAVEDLVPRPALVPGPPAGLRREIHPAAVAPDRDLPRHALPSRRWRPPGTR